MVPSVSFCDSGPAALLHAALRAPVQSTRILRRTRVSAVKRTRVVMHCATSGVQVLQAGVGVVTIEGEAAGRRRGRRQSRRNSRHLTTNSFRASTSQPARAATCGSQTGWRATAYRFVTARPGDPRRSGDSQPRVLLALAHGVHHRQENATAAVFTTVVRSKLRPPAAVPFSPQVSRQTGAFPPDACCRAQQRRHASGAWIW